MKRFWIMIPLLLLTLNLFSIRLVGAHPAQYPPKINSQELLAAVNDLRAGKKLPPYKQNSILMNIAQAQAEYVAGTGVITHFNAKGLPPFQRAINAGYFVAGDLSQGGSFLENIGSGAAVTASSVVAIWHEDPEDLQTLISADLRDVGVGVAVAGGISYYVLDVGASTNVSSTPTLSSMTISPLSGTPPTSIPISTPLEDGTVYHVVQSNEALWSIARNYNTTIENLKLLNRLPSNDIFEGQKLLIRKPEVKKTATSTSVASATFGIPTSTATRPVTSTVTFTATPLPTPPASRQNGEKVVGIIVLVALVAAGVGAWFGRKKVKADS
jgi:LysM repeat protein